jgi:hypothetical protein
MQKNVRVVSKLNPFCPEPKCKRILRIRKLKINLGLSACPRCGKFGCKPYILTEKKKGLSRCVNCHFDFKPKRREGYGRFWVCKDHPWQKFNVGSEVIIAKTKPKTIRELVKDVGSKRPFQAWKKRQQNVQRS